MSWLKRIKGWFSKEPANAIFDRSITDNPLREFIYLDEVSLRSLLSSKKGEMTSSTSKEVTETFEDEYRNSAGVGASGLAKAESTSRFQTRNSSTLQTAKKATVQSWFRELDKIRGIRLLETVQQVKPFANKNEISRCLNTSVSIEASKLKRGEIVEFRVRLFADPIFHLVTLVSEFKAMAEDYPDMMAATGGLKKLNEIEGISKVLQRLLAGLIPVRAEVLDYVVVDISGIEYLTHVDSIQGLDIERRSLEIVCVTELDAYWKDIRRVLFSGAEFTMLSRVSRTGLQEKWTPIKLADLLGGLVPGLSEQLDGAARLLFDSAPPQQVGVDDADILRDALSNYADAFLLEVEANVSDAQRADIGEMIANIEIVGHSVKSQKEAFKTVKEWLLQWSEENIDPQRDLELRQKARTSSGLPYFNSLKDRQSTTTATDKVAKAAAADDDRRFLDVEVVAMYW